MTSDKYIGPSFILSRVTEASMASLASFHIQFPDPPRQRKRHKRSKWRLLDISTQTSPVRALAEITKLVKYEFDKKQCNNNFKCYYKRPLQYNLQFPKKSEYWTLYLQDTFALHCTIGLCKYRRHTCFKMKQDSEKFIKILIPNLAEFKLLFGNV